MPGSRRNVQTAAPPLPEPVARSRRLRGRAWVVLGLLVAGLIAVGLVWSAGRGPTPATFELRSCDGGLPEGPTWEDIEAAGCAPTSIDGAHLEVRSNGEVLAPDSTAATSWAFEALPSRTIFTGMSVELPSGAGSVVLASPETRSLRPLRPDSAGTATTWTGHIGTRSATQYWILVAP